MVVEYNLCELLKQGLSLSLSLSHTHTQKKKYGFNYFIIQMSKNKS